MSGENNVIRVFQFTLTDTVGSEHIYGEELGTALSQKGIKLVEDWRSADVVHLFEVNLYTRDTIQSLKFPTLLRILWSDTPVVVSTDDLYFIGERSLTEHPRLYSLNHWTQRVLFRWCDGIIAISESVRNSLQPEIEETPIFVVRHGVSERYFQEYDNTSSDPFVLHVSLASKRKNPEVIRQVIQSLDARFVIAGGGWDEYLSVPQRTERVEVLGYVPENELIQLYKKSSIFYFPTLHEGFGLPVLEAMAARNAIVTSDVYAVPEVTGDTAILHDPHDVESHIKSIRDLMQNNNCRAELAAAAEQRARSFSWQQAADKTRRVYENVI